MLLLCAQGAVDHSVLMRWVWQYYLGEGEAQLDGSRASGATCRRALRALRADLR